MKTSVGRLNVPGFSFGIKTGEYIDVARLYGGKGAKRKSGKPHTYQELASRTGLKTVVAKANVARIEYNKDKRIRLRQAKKPQTKKIAAYCTRRYLEFSGLPTYNFKYAEPPETIIPHQKLFMN